MLRRLVVLVLVAVVVCSHGGARADEPTSLPAIDAAARFAELVRSGDKARAEGRLSDAVRAYSAALRIRRDARIRGKLGLIALEGGANAEAVGLLLEAFTDGHDAPRAERQKIFEAYERARPLVCRLDITVSHPGAEIRIDGVREPASAIDYFTFVAAGRHELRASLPGFTDALEVIDAPKGGRLRVALVLRPEAPPTHALPLPLPPAPGHDTADAGQLLRDTLRDAAPASMPGSSSSSSSTSAPASMPGSSAAGRWAFGAGPAFVFGGVSQLPASGFVASVERHLWEVFSARLDVRYAVSPYGIEGWPLRGLTVAAMPAACFARGIVFGCLLSHLGSIGHETDTSRTRPFSAWMFRFGLGASAGVDIPVRGPVFARITADAIVLQDVTPIRSGMNDSASLLWTGPPVMGGLSFAVVWRSGT